MSKISRHASALLVAGAFLVGCSTGEGPGADEMPSAVGGVTDSTSSGPDTTPEPAVDSTTTTLPPPEPAVDSTTTALPPPDPAVELQSLASVEGYGFSSGVISTDCGEVAFLGSGSPAALVHWSGEEWISNESVASLTGQFVNPVEDVATRDLNRDGVDELVVSMDPNGGMRSFGFVLSADRSSCTWNWLPLVDSCGDSRTYDSIALDRSGRLVGSGFPGGCSGRAEVVFEWYSGVERLVARGADGSSTCDGFYIEGEFDLPLMTCDNNWAVEIAQQVLSDEGYDVDIDGYFGPGTQIAVLEYQHDNELYRSGVLDGETWGSMFPINPDLGYVDYDGDGIPSPVEIGHYSGADLLYQDDGIADPPRRAVEPGEPFVVAVECEARPTGIVSSWTGPQYIYKQYHVMSDGRRVLAGTSHSGGGSSGIGGCG